ncbi:hypothetical protein [Microbacterium sulfonylureivorans]|uniref:hypothetical protein n=1 Tax=Microbacterium sulfonylureivorans TaxID=2486854 RepID=UPI000FD9EF75|nr:hypothetical protein [Microbacterium sulfonylureivorans]
MSRTVNVVRLQLINKQTYLWVPLLVLGGSLLITLAIYALLRASDIPPEPLYGGGSQAPLWLFLFVGIQALTLSFPFSQALSITRREFYLGTLLTATLASLLLGTVFVVGGFVEQLTGGWGLNGYFFRLDWVWEDGAAAAGLFYFMLAMMFFVVGFWSATIYKRFGALGLTTVLVGLGVLLVGALFVIGQADAWARVFIWFAELGALGMSLWGLVVVAVLAGISYLTLRRTVP